MNDVPDLDPPDMDLTDLDLDAVEERCRDASDQLASFELDLLDWCHRRHKPTAFRRDLRRLRAVADEMPDWWRGPAEAQVMAAAVMRRPDQIRKFRAGIDDSLGAGARRLLRHFGKAPWFWSVFSVIEPLRGDFYHVTEHLSESDTLLYSNALTTTYRQGARLFFTLSFWNGVCCQTFGPLHYYRGFEAADFTYLAKALLPDVLESQGLEAVVAARPAHFLLLDRWAEIPIVAHAGGPLHVCAHEARVDAFDLSEYAGDLDLWESNAAEGLFKASLEDSNPPMDCADIFHDRPRRRVLVVTNALEDYRDIARLLGDRVGLPDDPDWYASMNMVIAASQIANKEHPSIPYERRLEKPDRHVRETDLEPINALMRELNRCRNFGEDYALDELAARFGLTLETAREVEAQLQDLDEIQEIDIDGGLPDLLPPPPARRRELQLLPAHSDVFVLDYGAAAQHAYAERRERVRDLVVEQGSAGGDGEPSLAGLPRLLEDLFFASWQARDPIVLTYTLFLLCRAGDTPRSVRDYAVEVLRTFWQVLLPSRARSQLEGFIDKYGLFCWEVLEPLGLIEIEDAVDRTGAAEAAYRMSGGPLLKAFIRLSPEWQ